MDAPSLGATVAFRQAELLDAPLPEVQRVPEIGPVVEPAPEPQRGRRRALTRLREFWFGQRNIAPLCLFRIFYGLLLAMWLLQLWPDLAAFFTDEGMMPRSQLAASYPGLFSLLALFGQWWQVAIFWGGSLVVALMVAAGYRTRLACLLAFAVVISFENRNPLILDSSDYVFKVIPLWMLFTAAGDRYSLDALLRKSRGTTVTGFGPAFPVRVLEFQLAWVYLATALEKWAGKTWVDGTAVGYVFQLSHTFARPYVAPLALNGGLVRAFSWETMAVELAFLPLVFLPSPCRLIAVATAALLQLGILTMLNVGNFPLIMLGMLLLFLPSGWVDGLVSRCGRLPVWDFASRPFVHLPLPNERAGRPAGWQRPASYLALGLAAIGAFSLALPARFSGIAPSGQVREVLVFAGLDQSWNMFSPNPSRTDWSIRAPGQLTDGTEYDVLPSAWGATYSRWMKIVDRLSLRGYSGYLQEFGRGICRVHNNHLRPGQPQLLSFQTYFTDRVIGAPGGDQPAPSEELLWDHHCFG